MENFVEFGYVVFEICERRDRHTDPLMAILHTPTGSEVKTYFD